jgi:hypothetical protein
MAEQHCAMCNLYCARSEHSAARPSKWVVYRGKYWNAVDEWRPICTTCFKSEWREYKHDYAAAGDSWEVSDNVNKQFADGILLQISRKQNIDPECLQIR